MDSCARSRCRPDTSGGCPPLPQAPPATARNRGATGECVPQDHGQPSVRASSPHHGWMQTIGPQNMGNNPAMTMASRRPPWRSGRREPYLRDPYTQSGRKSAGRAFGMVFSDREGTDEIQGCPRGSALNPFYGLDDIPGIGVTVPMPD
jgi:hypothetical protein